MKGLILLALAAFFSASGVVASTHTPKAYEGLNYIGSAVRSLNIGASGPGIQAVGVQAVADYYTSFEKADWPTADDGCRRLTLGDGALMRIESAEEDRDVHNLVRDAFVSWKGELVWTAGVSTRTGAWFWDSRPDAIPMGSYRNFNPVTNPNLPSAYLAFTSVNEREYEWVPRRSGTEKNYYVCEVRARNDTPVPCKRENDLVIVLDGSGSIYPPDFLLGTDFAAQLAGAFLPPSRVSVVLYSTYSQIVFGLDSGLSPTQIDSTIKGDAVVQPYGNTDTAAAIEDAIAVLAAAPKPGIPRKLVVLTDGISNYPAATADAAARANAAGIQTFSVGIGSGVNMAELLSIAGGNSANRFTTDTFHDLIQLIAPVCIRVCQA